MTTKSARSSTVCSAIRPEDHIPKSSPCSSTGQGDLIKKCCHIEACCLLTAEDRGQSLSASPHPSAPRQMALEQFSITSPFGGFAADNHMSQRCKAARLEGQRRTFRSSICQGSPQWLARSSTATGTCSKQPTLHITTKFWSKKGASSMTWEAEDSPKSCMRCEFRSEKEPYAITKSCCSCSKQSGQKKRWWILWGREPTCCQKTAPQILSRGRFSLAIKRDTTPNY